MHCEMPSTAYLAHINILTIVIDIDSVCLSLATVLNPEPC